MFSSDINAPRYELLITVTCFWIDCYSCLVVSDNGDLAIYIYANKQKLEFSLSNCFALNNKGDVVSSLSSQKVGPPVDESDSGGQIASDIVKDICIEPAWHSGGFVRWKQLLKLSFGNYYCRLDSTGYLRIYKGKKVGFFFVLV